MFCCNFTPVPRELYRIGLPRHGRYREVFNTDSEMFGGGNVGNAGCVHGRRDTVARSTRARASYPASSGRRHSEAGINLPQRAFHTVATGFRTAMGQIGLDADSAYG